MNTKNRHIRLAYGFGKKIAAGILILIIIGWGNSVLSAEVPVDQTRKRLAVIGFTKNFSNPEWDNQLIGYGLSQLLLQKLYDTGRYTAVEDNPEIMLTINRLIEQQWNQDAVVHREHDAERIAGEVQADAVAYGKVLRFDTQRSRSFAGPISRSVTNVMVELEVYLKETPAPLRRSTAVGSAATRSVGMFFQIRDDKLYFDQTAVGRAAEQALTDAVNGLWKSTTLPTKGGLAE